MRHALRIVLVALAVGVAAASSDGAAEFQVVVNPSVRGTWISRVSLQAIFTGKSDRWGDKTAAKPVDQSAKAAVRRAFTVSVLGLSMGELQRYWQDRVAVERRFPPPIRGSDAEVLDFVAANTGAVGYVASDTAIPPGVKVIAITE